MTIDWKIEQWHKFECYTWKNFHQGDIIGYYVDSKIHIISKIRVISKRKGKNKFGRVTWKIPNRFGNHVRNWRCMKNSITHSRWVCIFFSIYRISKKNHYLASNENNCLRLRYYVFVFDLITLSIICNQIVVICHCSLT